MDTLDYRVGFSVDQSSVSQLQSLQAELQKISDLIAGVNNSSVRVGTGGGYGGGGGGGGGYGGGSGGSGASRRAAASASGLGNAINASYSSTDDIVPDLYPPLPPVDQRAAERADRQAAKDASWKNWALVSGFNAMAYGLEDYYYAGFRGIANNIPFMAQGLAAGMGLNPMAAMSLAGVGALGTTIGSMVYDNREMLFGEQALGSRENSIFGLPTRTESERYAKMAADSEYYVSKYGAGSRLGRYYAGIAGVDMARSQDLAGMDMSAERIAATIRTPTAAQIASADRMQVLNAPFGGVMDRLTNDFSAQNMDRYMAEARKNAEDRVGFFESISASKIEEEARKRADEEAARFVSPLMAAVQGDPSAIRTLEQAVNDQKYTQQQRDQMRSVLNLSQNLSGYDRDVIATLRSGAGNPFADIESRRRQINGMLESRGASPEDAAMFGGAIYDQMQQDKANARMPWQDLINQNSQRWIGNIAASFGSIETNSPYARSRNAQAANMRAEIYNTLIQSGVPAAAAAQQTDMLYQQGFEEYQRLVSASQGNVMGFMANLDGEQQMAFGQYQQNFAQIQMQRSAWMNQARMYRSRVGFRGAR